MHTRLSVNINKIATLRNSRGGNNPDVVQTALNCESFGAEGITVHPRPDERHIRYEDVRELKKVLRTEFNIEGNPKEEKFVQLVLDTLPTQVTLVPDSPNQLTSNHGWDTIKEQSYLQEIISAFKKAGIRVSIFVDPIEKMIEAAVETGTERVELYTEDFAKRFHQDKQQAIAPYQASAILAQNHHLGVNAGHDLDLQNLQFFAKSIPNLLEVSIGHALISDALYYGLENTIQMYRRKLSF
ncbi:MAG: pyridoxine 5'-phosphate synthase [Bacteroidetes bacterium]|nr:pyridoxine 5'-phosphate synthase [Bacteroidota bacterium]